MTAEQAVHNGAALLDEKLPGWHRRIDLGTLRIESIHRCILGQLGEGIIHPAHEAVFGSYDVSNLGRLWREHGFSGVSCNGNLEAAWAQEVTDRLAHDREPVVA